jgi:hypothetical protein
MGITSAMSKDEVFRIGGSSQAQETRKTTRYFDMLGRF